MADVSDRKRLRADESQNEDGEDSFASSKRRRSRFGDESSVDAKPVESITSAVAQAISAVSAKAAQLKQLSSEAKAQKAAEMQKQLANQMASVSSILEIVAAKKKAAALEAEQKKQGIRPLLLDAQGREIDEHGNLVEKLSTSVIKTLAANATEKKKKENPYLSNNFSKNDESEDAIAAVDERIFTGLSRDQRGRKALKFVEAGSFLQQAELLKSKEERKIIAGYASGRKAPELIDDEVIDKEPEDIAVVVGLPPPIDGGVVPSMEWWDEAFLPKDLRQLRKVSRAAAEEDHYDKLAVTHCKTHKYIHHPPSIKPLGGEAPDIPLPMFLTKKERKRIRKATRAEREQEKRDKLMLGLIPAPEPKFKLSNFMKILGDQAVADPSKIEMRVMEQMKKRVLNHEMKNLASKLTPKERREKRLRKNQEDTARQVHVAVFRIKDFSNTKHRFKVDVNAQQYFLSGTVVLCPEGDCNLVIVEGGPRGIRRFARLMLARIRWSERAIALPDINTVLNDEKPDDEDDDTDSRPDNDEPDDEVEPEHNENEKNSKTSAYEQGATTISVDEHDAKIWNYCALVWQGIMPKRTFTGFKFQECRSMVVARKMLEGRNIAHLWDMALQCTVELDSNNNNS